jgi:hypothetical protein
MTLDWFHAVLGMFFVAIWLIVGQILALERRHLDGQRKLE